VTNLVGAIRLRLVLAPVLVTLALIGLYTYLSLYPCRDISCRDLDELVLNGPYLTKRILEHLEISGFSFGAAALLGVPLGILLAQSGGLLRTPVFAFANLGQAVPSVGILALGFTYFGIGIRGAILALIIYALLPILRNTVVGLEAVDRGVQEAALGMGMSGTQVLVSVRLPLASPVIFAGLRVALVLVIGTATLANFIGGGGLGDLIAASDFYHPRPILVGAVLVSSLALLADWALGLVERFATPHIEDIRRNT
jgi:osmoprotectant transport system permease protein